MASSAARVFNIPASAPFLPVLVRTLLAGELISGFPGSQAPLELTRLTLYLPTRRAVRLARETFLLALGGQAAILPRIAAIGDIDEDELIFAQAATGDLAESALGLPDTLQLLERKLLLTQLIMQWAASPALRGAAGTPLVANTPSAALALADDLARLIDDMTTRGVGWDKLDELVPGEYDKYWELSVALLDVLRQKWPDILTERGLIEPAERRDLLIKAKTERLRHGDAPVIVAGSTGSMPATASLIATVASLPHGAVVLPGLDMVLDDTSWRGLSGDPTAPMHDGGMPAFGHPQFAMQALLTRIGMPRDGVIQLAAAQGRDRFLSEVLRPAATTEQWPARRKDQTFVTATAQALSGMTLIEAANDEEEGLAVAITLREADHEGKSAALITPDRALARRVLAALARWNVAVDDSGGDALADTPAGIFARLVADVALGDPEPVTLLALLKDPLFRLSDQEGAHAGAIAALERAVLRGPRPKPGSAGLANALASFRAARPDLHPRDPRKLVSPERLDAAETLVRKLGEARGPLESAPDKSTLADFAKRHLDCIKALAGDAAFLGPDGKQLEAALNELIDARSAQSLQLDRDDYPDFVAAALASRIVRMREQPGVRIRIFGPLEARLQNVDRIVLGGLNEASWPPETRTDAWLSRPMRLKLGLDLPERRVGLAAHDFAQALGAEEVILTRAAKVAGAPTVASRFVQRMAALADEQGWEQVKQRGEHYLGYAKLLDAPDGPANPIPRPQPNPPIEARPMQLSVTDIEHWLRDPYTIYAKHVLRLVPLDAVDTPPGAGDRGSVIHEAIGDFTKTFAAALPPDPEKELIALGEKSFAPLGDYPEARAFWWPRFKRIARWFAAWERERRPQLAAIYGEITGRLAIPFGNMTFTLTARADRIERLKDGRYAIIDYKTGAPPTEPQVRTGLSPQLTLEGAILRAGGFAELPPGSIAHVTYVRLRGGEKAGEPKEIKFDDGTPDSQSDAAKEKLTAVAAKFLVEGEPFRSLVHPMWKRQYGEYDHLARVKEWAASGGESEADFGPPS
jgi:ATP-dependent helicase/nuclease subunit B